MPTTLGNDAHIAKLGMELLAVTSSERFIGVLGFGFLIPDEGGSNNAAHRSALVLGSKLSPGEQINFEAVDDGKQRGTHSRPSR